MNKNTLVIILDFVYGVVKRYFRYIMVYCTLISSVVIVLNTSCYMVNTYFKQSLSTLDIRECILKDYDYIYAIILIDIILALLFYCIKRCIFIRPSSFSNIMELNVTFVILALSRFLFPVINMDQIIIVFITYFIVTLVYKTLVKKMQLNSRYFWFAKGNCSEPLGKAVISSEITSENHSDEEKTVYQPKTVQELIDELEKVKNKEMEVAVRCNDYVIRDIEDTFECESDGIPFICIDCKDVIKK